MRRRNTPWIHRWSRVLIGAIAGLGILNTGYITFTKLFGGETACPTSGCEQVLSGPYAYLFGLPLSLFGLLAYIAIAVFALAPLAVKSEGNKQLRANLETWTWLLLFVGTTAMVIFSGYLMYIMASKYIAVYGAKGICVYCIASALTATALFVLTLVGHAWEDVGQLFFVGIVVGMVTLIGTLGVYARLGSSQTAQGNAPPPIETTSSAAEIGLAKHLRKVGAKMYGAYWCPHCHEQEKLFGKEAFAEIDYVECAADGQNARTSLCEQVAPKIEQQTGQRFGFPTWEINGKFYPGRRTLNELAEASGYTGPRNFQNQF